MRRCREALQEWSERGRRGRGTGTGWAVTGQEIIESILLPLKHPVLPRLSSFFFSSSFFLLVQFYTRLFYVKLAMPL